MKLYSLALVVDICMCSDLNAIVAESFKHYHGFSGQTRCVESKRNFDSALGALRRKFTLGGDLFAVYEQFAPGGLVHENTRQLVGLSGSQALVGHSVSQGDLPGRLDLLFAINSSSSLYLGLLPKGDCLALVLDITVGSDLKAVTVQCLKYYD